MKKVILLGTSHDIQRGNEQNDSFSSYIEHLCKTNDIKAIAEEIDDGSIAEVLSKKFNILYEIIEPTLDEREKLGIEDRTNIDYEFRHKYKVKNYSDELGLHNLSAEGNEAYVERIQNVYRQRESEWLRRICKLDTWPVLVICGSMHVDPFFTLLSKEGIDVVKKIL